MAPKTATDESDLYAHRAMKSARPRPPTDPSSVNNIPLVLAGYDDGASFLRCFDPAQGPAGVLAVPTRFVPTRGAAVVVEIAWHGIANRVICRGSVIAPWDAGWLVVQLHRDEIGKRDWLVRAARGETAEAKRRKHRRFSVRLPLMWRPFGEVGVSEGIAEDLSAGGVLISAPTSSAPQIATKRDVAVKLRADDDAHDLVLTGRVRHVRARGAKEIVFGVQFEYRASGEQRTLRSMLRGFAAHGRVVVHPML